MKDLTGNVEKDLNIVLKDLIDGDFDIKDINELDNYVEVRRRQKSNNISNNYLKNIFDELEVNNFICSKRSDVVNNYIDGSWSLSPIILTEKGRDKIKLSTVIKDSSAYKATETIKNILK